MLFFSKEDLDQARSSEPEIVEEPLDNNKLLQLSRVEYFSYEDVEEIEYRAMFRKHLERATDKYS